MAWNPSPKVADCREIARKWGFRKVIILALENEQGAMTMATYGETKAMCADAERLGNEALKAVFNAYDADVPPPAPPPSPVKTCGECCFSKHSEDLRGLVCLQIGAVVRSTGTCKNWTPKDGGAGREGGE